MTAESVVAEIQAERERQVAEEGWTHEHDDTVNAGPQLARAAAVYAALAGWVSWKVVGPLWPWQGLPKMGGQRRVLVKAAALIVAAIEQIDRQEERRQRSIAQGGI